VIRMLCRNRVADFAKWKAIFDFHRDAHRRSGLTLEALWRAVDNPNNVFFVFAVADLESAKAFITSPDAAKAGKESGVLDGDYWFVSDAGHGTSVA